VCICEAHVRLIHKSYFSRPIRNAPSAIADGTLSTSGPCGGSLKWGNATFSQVTEGENVSLVFAYNGGHQDPILNMLRIAMVCGRPDSDAPLRNKMLSIARTTSALVNASASSTAGYDLWVVIPPTNKTQANGTFCTISALDERQWGGCIDVEVVSAPNTNPQTNALVGKSLAGTFSFEKSDCIVDSPNCCCASGSVTVKHTAGALSATASANISPTSLCVNKTFATTTLTQSVSLTQIASNLASVKGEARVANYTLGFVVEAGTPNRLLVTDDSAVPGICGFHATVNGPLPSPVDDSAASVAQWMGSALFAIMFSLCA